MRFIEARSFTDVVGDYFGGDEAYRRLQSTLAAHPTLGTIIRGAAPVRKVRWSDPERQKGKRGGLRILYLYLPDIETFYMARVYDKDEADDLSAYEKRVLRRVADHVVRELRAASDAIAP